MSRPHSSLDEPLSVSSRTARYSSEHVGYAPLDEQIHFASIQEKKRLWWRNATINALFIGSWFVSCSLIASPSQMFIIFEREIAMILQVSFCNYPIRLQQMDVFGLSHELSIPPVCHDASYVCPICFGSFSASYLAPMVQARQEPVNCGLWVSVRSHCRDVRNACIRLWLFNLRPLLCNDFYTSLHIDARPVRVHAANN